MEKVFCLCGCESEINLGKKFVHGHNRRGKTFNVSEETRKKLYFVAIVTSFCARLYGLRLNKRRTEKLIQELQHEDNQVK